MAGSVFSGDLIGETNKRYPFMQNNSVGVKINHGRPGSQGYLEAFPPGETGRPAGSMGPDDPGLLRPSEFPIGASGIEVYSDEVNPADLAGDIFTHTDKVGERMSNDLAQTINGSQEQEMSRQYLDYNETIKEGSPNAEARALANGTDGLLRTSVFGQGGPGAVNGLDRFNFNIEQQNILDGAKSYVNTGKDPGRSMFTMRKSLGL